MQATDLMTTAVVSVGPGTEVREVARLLLEHHISAVPVVNSDNRILGIVSEGDLMRRAEVGTERHRSWWLSLVAGADRLAREYVKSHGRRAADVMTRDVVTVAEDTPAREIAGILEKRRIKRVPVVRDGRLVGIVSRADLLRGLAVQPLSPEAPSMVDDRLIRERLLRELRGTAWASPVSNNVVVKDVVVHLWGLVSTEDERRALRVAASNVPGVRAVEDHLLRVPELGRAE
jgi:CBS domain-containing protein